MGDLIRVTCIDQTFDFIDSGDLTLAKLQTEMSLLMGCKASDLDLVASDIGLAVTMGLGVTVPAVFKPHAIQVSVGGIHIAGSVGEDEDEEMTDVNWD